MTKREEALAAMQAVETMLAKPALSDLDRTLMQAALQHAMKSVEEIDELKRARRKVKA